jgi:transposase
LNALAQLSDAQWEQIQPLLPKYVSKLRQNPSDRRLVIEGILWVIGTGASWREVPERFGPWGRMAEHYYRWCKDGRWALILQVLLQQEVPISSSA